MSESIEFASSNNSSATSDSPLSSSQLAELLGVSRKTISQWADKVREAHFWLDEADFTIGKGNRLKYTTFCIEQMKALQASASHYQWVKQVQKNAPVDNKLQAATGVNPSTAMVDDPPEAMLANVKSQLATIPRSTITNPIIKRVDAVMPEMISANIAETQQATQETIDNLQLTMAAMATAFVVNNQAQFKGVGATAANMAIGSMAEGMISQFAELMNNPQGMQQMMNQMMQMTQQQQGQSANAPNQ